MDMDTLYIKSKLYDYSVEFVDSFAEKLKNFKNPTAYVIDKKVYALYKREFTDIDSRYIYYLDAVEAKKNMDTVMDIISFWQKSGVRKNWTIICVGGGITQDVTTIASNLFLRNIEWYFFPTTLLSMCDSCIGGKCGINFNGYKNQIGVFYPPHKIFIDTKFIDTLTQDDYINGWGELLKFSLTSNSDFFNKLLKEKQYIPCKEIAQYIYAGLLVKKAIIEEDEFETDLRRVLNYGHTFGHALEAYSHNEIPHGKGVIWGIDVVNFIAWKRGLISSEYYYQIKSLIKKEFITKEIVIQEPDNLFEIIKTDKKVKGNILNFALLDGVSHLIVYPIVIDEGLKQIFYEYLGETHEYYCD